MTPIVDMGLYFDGKCARCREWIRPGDRYRALDEPPNPDVRHSFVHAAEQGDEFVCDPAFAEGGAPPS